MLAMLMGSFSIAAMAQSKEDAIEKEKHIAVPVAVKNAFEKDYPAVKKVSWDAEDNEFEAEFKMNNTETSATYDAAGKRKEVETEILVSQLPPACITYIQKTHNGFKTTEASKITNDKSQVLYEVEVSKGKTKIDLLFDAKGNFIKHNPAKD